MKQLAVIVLLACAACTSTLPKLTQDAQLVLNPSAPPPGLKTTRIGNSDWPQVAAKLCSDPQYQCIRIPITVSLTKRDGSEYHMVLRPPTPIIQKDNIYIFAGQTLYVETDISAGTLVNMRLVKDIVHPEKTLTISFSQQSTQNGRVMILFIQNPYNNRLKYHALMMPLEGPDGALYKTDTCPVIGKISATEIWPMPLFQLVLTDFRFLTPNQDLTCSY